MLDVPNEMPGMSTCRVHVPPMHVPRVLAIVVLFLVMFWVC